MKRILPMLALSFLLPACACAAQITVTELADSASGSTLAVFSVEEDTIDMVPGKQTELGPVTLTIGTQIEARFNQQKALVAMGRGTVMQEGSVWQDGKTASMALFWQGEQASGREGSAALGLTVNLETGEEILLEQLFADWDGALSAMETIISDDVLEGMSDYMEYSDLLPMPTDNYAFNEQGLTVYWDEDRYRYFDGTCGSVTFYWHELAEYIGEDSPAYAVSRIQDVDVQKLRDALAIGTFSGVLACNTGNTLAMFESEHALADPDYTTDAMVYPFERLRGFAAEIPKYAETEESETPVSAIRASRISYHGLTTGKTEIEDVYPIFGNPAKEIVYDEDAAFDAMLEPGESLFYKISGRVLQLHFDEDGVLSCVIIRDAMPESLY